MVVASRADALAKAAGTPLNLQQLWLTGLPRHDLVTRRQDALPADLRRAEQELRDRLGGRRLVVLWPRPGRSPVRSRDSRARAARVVVPAARRRPRRPRGPGRPPGSLTQTLTPSGAWGLSARRVPDPSVVLRVADAVVTDGADDAVDFLLTGRPLLVLTPRCADRRGGRPLPAASRAARTRCAVPSTSSRPPCEAVFDAAGAGAGRGLRAGRRPRLRAHRRPVGLAAGGAHPSAVPRRLSGQASSSSQLAIGR